MEKVFSDKDVLKLRLHKEAVLKYRWFSFSRIHLKFAKARQEALAVVAITASSGLQQCPIATGKNSIIDHLFIYLFVVAY